MEERQEAIKQLLQSIDGEVWDREGLKDTPNRIARMYNELFSGYRKNPKEILSKQFDAGPKPVTVTVKDISFFSMCEHHMMPFFGTVDITYTPKVGGKVVGLSKLARLVECHARRLQIQERMCQNILADIVDNLHPANAKVCIIAEHTCMTARGVNKPGSKTYTEAVYY